MSSFFLKLKYLLVLLTSFTVLLTSCKVGEGKTENNKVAGNSPWLEMDKIINSVKPLKFPSKVYDITTFGAKPGGTHDNTEAINKAIKECSQNGGGMVLVPNGKFLTGPIKLENNVNLHLDDKSELMFSPNTDDYYPLVHTSFEGTELMNYTPLIYAYQKKNIAITGKGVLNGQSNNDNWWYWCGKDEYGWKKGMRSQNEKENRYRLVELAEKNVPVSERVFGKGFYLRPNFIEVFECTDVLIQNVTIVDVPFWVIHPLKSTNVTVDGVTVNSHGPNNDGCDPEYSKNVIIKNCIFNTGDDCIAIKSGRDADGRRVAMKTENVIVKDCKMYDGHGGVTIGSEISGGVSNVFVENCMMDSPNLDRAIRFKTNSNRGGTTENVYVRNLTIGQVKEAVLKIDMAYTIYPGDNIGNYTPKVENILLDNIKVKNAGKNGIVVKGLKESMVKNVTINNTVMDKVESPIIIENTENFKFNNTYINGKLMENKNTN